jgi:predicted nucleic acid-binding Zn ribbon protein
MIKCEVCGQQRRDVTTLTDDDLDTMTECERAL